MSLICGYFNQEYHDRYYNAGEMNELFNGQMTYGVFDKVYINRHLVEGNSLKVERVSESDVETSSSIPETFYQYKIRPGKAWYKNYWIINDEDYVFSIDPVDNGTIRNTIVALEINAATGIREASVKLINGEPLANQSTVAERQNINLPYVMKKEGLALPDVKEDYNLFYLPLAMITLGYGTLYTPAPSTQLSTGPEMIIGAIRELADKRKIIRTLLDYKNFKVVNNLRTSEPGSALDARMGTKLNNIAPFAFGIDSKGRYGFIKDGTNVVIPF